MSDTRTVPYGDDPSATATLLLAAADDLGLQRDVVRTTSDRVFKVPAEVATKAGLDTVEDGEPDAEQEKPARRRRAKTDNDKEKADG